MLDSIIQWLHRMRGLGRAWKLEHSCTIEVSYCKVFRMGPSKLSKADSPATWHRTPSRIALQIEVVPESVTRGEY